jgi:hypothetical protein
MPKWWDDTESWFDAQVSEFESQTGLNDGAFWTIVGLIAFNLLVLTSFLCVCWCCLCPRGRGKDKPGAVSASGFE